MTDCIFCKIIRQEIPSQVVYTDERVMVIKDIHPVAPVHLLVIPKQHLDNICDPVLLQPETAAALFQSIQEIARREGLKSGGFRVVANYGKDAGETVPHLHFHILAGRLLTWPPG